jgi:hypothetical protein
MQRFQLQDHGKPGRPAQFVRDDVAGNFDRQSEWKSHKIISESASKPLPGYKRATVCVGSDLIAGKVASGFCGGGSAFINPGRRKVAGETLWLAFMPLQPAVSSNALHAPIGKSSLRFNLTESEYKVKRVVCNR